MNKDYPEQLASEIRPDKSPSRVSKGYIKHPSDWVAQYRMLLPDGVTCASCIHCNKCVSMFGQKEEDTKCQFYPSKFNPNE